ncbi:MAG: hypothetical protein ACNA7W_20650, partial [Pseudomonadales bacterium]
ATIPAMNDGDPLPRARQQPETGFADRRRQPRFEAAGLDVRLRSKGSLAAIPARPLDFNRFGVAVQTGHPLAKDRTVYLSLRCDGLQVDGLVGVVHNCLRQGEYFRSGIRFRLASNLQRDRQQIEQLLGLMEDALQPGRRSA